MSFAFAPARAADLVLRAATLDDAAFVADLYTENFPDEPEDPALFRHWWETSDPRWTIERHIATAGGEAVGFAGYWHAPWSDMPERFSRVTAELRPSHRTPERADALFALLEERGRQDGTLRVTAWTWEHDAPRIAVLEARGYREERRERFWELDLAAQRARLEDMTQQSRERMRREDIRVLTMAEDPDPERYRRLWAMSEEASQDTPRTVPWTPTPFDVFMKWFSSPGIREDRMWVARSGEEMVGISVLSYPPVRGVVTTDWTATARSVRGKGVARALKCETVMQAIALGVDRVRTDNDFRNAPILHLNESMGYRRRPEMIQLLKELAVS